jgi:hypothetical protein
MNAPIKSNQNRNQNQMMAELPSDRHRLQADRRVRFASHSTLQSFTSVLAVCSKQELWYSNREVRMMRLERNRDAFALVRALLSPSAEDMEEGIDISKVVGLDKLVSGILKDIVSTQVSSFRFRSLTHHIS